MSHVKRQKNDAADAAAICETVARATGQLCGLSRSRRPSSRARLLADETDGVRWSIRQAIPRIEFGMVAVGSNGVEELLGAVADPVSGRR
jgi:hypothetical protein